MKSKLKPIINEKLFTCACTDGIQQVTCFAFRMCNCLNHNFMIPSQYFHFLQNMDLIMVPFNGKGGLNDMLSAKSVGFLYIKIPLHF